MNTIQHSLKYEQQLRLEQGKKLRASESWGWTGDKDLTNASMLNVFDDMIGRLDNGAVWVEVGVWCGAGIRYAMEESIRQDKEIDFHGVDIFVTEFNGQQQLDIFKSHTGLHNYMLTTHIEESVKAAEQFDHIDFVFIDADHTYDSVMSDLNAWWPKTKFMAGDDYTPEHPGVVQAVDQFKEKNNLNLTVRGITWELF